VVFIEGSGTDVIDLATQHPTARWGPDLAAGSAGTASMGAVATGDACSARDADASAARTGARALDVQDA
jgi:hypothetical protein